MHQKMMLARFERQGVGILFQKLGQVFVEQEDVSGHRFGVGARNQVGIVIADGEHAARFQANDGNAGPGVRQQDADELLGPAFGPRHEPLRKRRTAAILLLGDLHPETRRLQHFCGGQPHFRLVEFGESVGIQSQPRAIIGLACRLLTPTGAERPSLEMGKIALGVDVKRLLDHPLGGREIQGEIRQRRQRCGQSGKLVDVSENFFAEWRALAAVFLSERLLLELGHIHAGRTFALAGLAAQAEIEGVGQGGIMQAVRQITGQGGAEQVGPPPRAVDLVLRRLEGGAHHIDFQLAANAGAVAHFHGLSEAPIGRPVENGVHRHGLIIAPVAQILLRRQGLHDFARVHAIVRVENAFHLLEQAVNVGAEEIGIEVAASEAIAVLAAGHAVVFFGERGRVGDQPDQIVDAFLRFQAEDGAHVDAAGRGVGVHRRFDPARLDRRKQIGHVIGQVFRRNRHIFDAGQRFGVPAHGKQQPQSRLAHIPDIGLARPIGDLHHRLFVTRPRQVLFQSVHAVGDVSLIVSREFDDVNDGGIALDKGQALVPGRCGPRQGEQVVVDQFHSRGIERQKAGHSTKGRFVRGIMQDRQPFAPGDGNQTDLRLQDQPQRALAPRQQLSQIEMIAVELLAHVIQIVAARAPPVFGELLIDESGVGAQQCRDLPVQRPLDAAGSGLFVYFRPGYWPQPHFPAIRQHRAHALHVVCHHAVDDGMGAGAVVPDDATDRGPVRAGGVWSHREAVGSQAPVEDAERDAGLGAHAPLFSLDLDDVVHVFGEVDDHGLAHGLPGQAGGSAARQHRQIVLDAGRGRGQHILFVAGHDNGQGQNLVIGGVGAVKQARGQVGVHFGAAALFQLGGEVLQALVHKAVEGESEESRRTPVGWITKPALFCHKRRSGSRTSLPVSFSGSAI